MIRIGCAWLYAFALLGTGCLQGLDPIADGSGSATPPTASGLISAPVHGTVVDGDTSTLSIHVAGLYDGDGALSVQVLSDPSDLTSWTTIGTATANAAHSFETDVQPVDNDADAARWPNGGVLRLRVIDSTGLALPRDVNDTSATVVALANPADEPASWSYLAQIVPGDATETAAYYQAIAAPATLDAWKTQFGFPSKETNVKYYNSGDLGIGRDMHCRATSSSGGVACYVENYGTFGGDQGDAISQLVAGGTPLATVVMVYTPPITDPNAVTFYVYAGATGNLATSAQLDTHGDNVSIPQNCLNCHGGRSSYNSSTHTATNARFLPFDPAAFVFPDDPSFTLAAQTKGIQKLNQMVAPGSTTAEQEVIDGLFPSAGVFDDSFVPDAWNTSARDAQLYRGAIAPYCRGCHSSFATSATDVSLTFDTPADLRANGASALTHICGAGPLGMPIAEATTKAFYAGAGRALLLDWLGGSGACTPQ